MHVREETKVNYQQENSVKNLRSTEDPVKNTRKLGLWMAPVTENFAYYGSRSLLFAWHSPKFVRDGDASIKEKR